MAASGPLLTTVIVKVTTSPTFGLLGMNVLDSDRSAVRGVTTALSSSFSLWPPSSPVAESGLNWSLAVTWGSPMVPPGASMVASYVNVSVALAATLRPLQVIVRSV